MKPRTLVKSLIQLGVAVAAVSSLGLASAAVKNFPPVGQQLLVKTDAAAPSYGQFYLSGSKNFSLSNGYSCGADCTGYTVGTTAAKQPNGSVTLSSIVGQCQGSVNLPLYIDQQGNIATRITGYRVSLSPIGGGDKCDVLSVTADISGNGGDGYSITVK